MIGKRRTAKDHQQAVNTGMVASTRPGFVPRTPWPELEAAREAHEKAIEEHASEEARRQRDRQQERELEAHLAAVRRAQQEAREVADTECKAAVRDALGVVRERGDKWLAEIEAARAAALQECAKLRARADELEAQAHENDDVEAWIRQALEGSVPQPFAHVAERPAGRGVTA